AGEQEILARPRCWDRGGRRGVRALQDGRFADEGGPVHVTTGSRRSWPGRDAEFALACDRRVGAEARVYLDERDLAARGRGTGRGHLEVPDPAAVTSGANCLGTERRRAAAFLDVVHAKLESEEANRLRGLSPLGAAEAARLLADLLAVRHPPRHVEVRVVPVGERVRVVDIYGACVALGDGRRDTPAKGGAERDQDEPGTRFSGCHSPSLLRIEGRRRLCHRFCSAVNAHTGAQRVPTSHAGSTIVSRSSARKRRLSRYRHGWKSGRW